MGKSQTTHLRPILWGKTIRPRWTRESRASAITQGCLQRAALSGGVLRRTPTAGFPSIPHYPHSLPKLESNQPALAQVPITMFAGVKPPTTTVLQIIKSPPARPIPSVLMDRVWIQLGWEE